MSQVPEMKPPKDQIDLCLKALDYLQSWCTWAAALELALIGAIGALLKDSACHHLYVIARVFAALSALAGMASLFCAGQILYGLPGITMRLPPPEGDDVLVMRTGGRSKAGQPQPAKTNGRQLSFWAIGQIRLTGLSVLLFALFAVFPLLG